MRDTFKIEYVSNDATKPFRLWFLGKQYRIDLKTLGHILDQCEAAFDRYHSDRSGDDPRTRRFDNNNPIDEAIRKAIDEL